MSAGNKSAIPLPATPFSRSPALYSTWAHNQRPLQPAPWHVQPSPLSPLAQAQIAYDLQMAQWSAHQHTVAAQHQSSPRGSPAPSTTPPDFDYFAQNVLAPGFQQYPASSPLNNPTQSSVPETRGKYRADRRQTSSPPDTDSPPLGTRHSPRSSTTSLRNGRPSSRSDLEQPRPGSRECSPVSHPQLVPPHHRRYSSSSTVSSNSSSSYKAKPLANTTTRATKPSPLSTASFTVSTSSPSDRPSEEKNDHSRNHLPKSLQRFGRFTHADGDIRTRPGAPRRASLPTDSLEPSSPGLSPPASSSPDLSSSPTIMRRKSLFSTRSHNNRMSTDNISLSSTMSSASVMMHKMGAGLGALGSKIRFGHKNSSDAEAKRKRDSLGAITGFFGKKGQKEGTEPAQKGATAGPSLSYTIAESDRAENSSSDSDGLTPAARLALQHTLQSRAEEKAAIMSEKSCDSVQPDLSVTSSSILVEADEDGTDDFVVVGVETATQDSRDSGRNDEEDEDNESLDAFEPWGQTTISKGPPPARGILKRPKTKGPSTVLDHSAPMRESLNANSVPLAGLPCLSPDQVDGLQRRSSLSSRISREDSLPKKDPMKENLDPSPVPSVRRSRNSRGSSKKSLAFANTLMVYDTFGSSDYDRRNDSTPWTRLTPELVMEIREELQTYKMEEMVVHSSYLTNNNTTSY